MPLFAFCCPAGHAFRRILDQPTPEAPCPVCGAQAARRARGASALVMETVDNGLQARATVRLADAERLFKEREIENDQRLGSDPDEDDLERLDDSGELL